MCWRSGILAEFQPVYHTVSTPHHNIVNTIRRKYWYAFVGYLYIYGKFFCAAVPVFITTTIIITISFYTETSKVPIVSEWDEYLCLLGHYALSTGNSYRRFGGTILLRNIKQGKAVPLQAWGGPEGSRKLRFPDFMTTAQDGGKVVSSTHRPPLPPGNTPGTHFC